MWVCVFELGFWLRPATPGWGARCGCVCSGSGFGCAPPLLAGVFGCVCARVRAPLAPRHSWHGCAVWLCVFGLGFRLRPATPGWGVGLCVCSCARSAGTLPLLARVRGVGVCVWVRVSAALRHSWLGCWAVCVLLWALRLHPATPGWGARRGYVCLGPRFGCAPPLLAGVLGCVCARVGALVVPRHSWLGCALWLCVFELGFRLRPATPGWGVGLCVCSCARSAGTLPLLARVRGVGVCVWVRVSAAPPPLLAGVLGCVCAGVGVPLAPRHSWLGCAPWVCVFGLAFRLRPATPGWGVGVCVCSCRRSGCTPPLLAGVRAVGVCVWARVSAAPRQSWLGCWVVCVPICVPPLYPATPGWGVRCECVRLSSDFGCAPPLLAELLGCVCARACAPLAPCHSWLGCAVWVCVFALGFWLPPATPGWGLGLCVCLCARFACTLPLLAGVHSLGVCVWARVSPAPRRSWPGCWALCVLVCALRLHPVTPGTGARCECVCLGSGLGCAPPLVAGVCVVGVCVLARVLAAPRHSWLGFVVFGSAVAWHLFVCCGSLRVVRALQVSGTRRPSLLGTCPCALVVASGVPPWRASWPRVVRRALSGPVALGASIGFPVAVVPFPNPGACAPSFTGRLRGARGGRPRTGLFVPAPGPRRGGAAGLAPHRTRSRPCDGVLPGGSLRCWSWAACAAVVGVCGPGH